jgi:hypothetical protein
VLDGVSFGAPLKISSRLMAAYEVAGLGTFHVLALPRDRTGRVPYRWLIEDGNGNELESGEDLRSGVGDPVDYPRIMATLLSFLSAAGESYPDGENVGSFLEDTALWASLNSDEIALAGLEIDPDEINEG